MKVTGYEYDKFDEFVKTFFIEKKSYATIYGSIKDVVIDDIIKVFKKWEEDRSKIDKNATDKEGKYKECNDNLITQINTLQDGQKHLLANALWLWALPFGNFNNLSVLKYYGLDEIANNNVWGLRKVGLTSLGANPSSRNFVIPSILEFISGILKKELKKETYKEDLKNCIKTKDDLKTFHNAILHCLDPDNVEAIMANEEKKKIVKAFSKLDGVNSENSIDDKISKIREKLGGLIGDKQFWDPSIAYMWKLEKEDDVSAVQLLKYKKAMILYGPPGTGKTYTAYELAKKLIFNSCGIKKFCKNISNKIDDYIIRKQMHVNYSYEQFVGGMTIEGGSAKFKPGFIFEICKKAEEICKKAEKEETAEKDETPLVVILDEINRVDISRVFGEVFTAMEPSYRGKPYSIAINGEDVKPLVIPDNLYIIGTMNEIDFSIEHMDFALRRRFVWNYVGYDSEALNNMVVAKLKEKEIVYNLCDIESFIESCNELNKKIENNTNALGKEYKIGHAFFADVVYIIKNLLDGKNKTVQAEIWSKAKNILWEISIGPTIRAYLGSNDDEDFYKQCMEAFLNKDGKKDR